MRKIKLYEDFNTPEDFIKELKDFCEMYLAYLIDEGFEVNVINNMHDKDLLLNIERVSSFNNYTVGENGIRSIDNSFRWSEVSDHFITFYHMLSKEYKLLNHISIRQEMTLGRRVGWVWERYDIDTLIKLDPDTKIDKIQIPVKE